MEKLRLEQVFTVAGVPTYTYVVPYEYNELLVAVRTPGKCIVIEGPSGIGKTTAIIKILNQLQLSEVKVYSARKESDLLEIRNIAEGRFQNIAIVDDFHRLSNELQSKISDLMKASVYKGYKRDKIEMRGDRAEMSDFPLYLNAVAGGLDCRNQAIGGFSFVVKIYALPVVEIIGQFLYLLGRYGFDAQIGYCF